MKKILLIFFSGVILASGYAQDSIPMQVERLLELISEQSGNEDTDYSQLTLLLKTYLEDPLDLNSATDAELEDLQVLNSLQIQMLRQHISKHGKLLSVYELQSIDGFNEATLRALFPFVTVHGEEKYNRYTLKAALFDGKHEIILRAARVLEPQLGFSETDSVSLLNSLNSRYAGDPYKLYARYRFTFGNRVSAGITAEKDPGEVLIRNKLRIPYAFYSDTLSPYLRNGADFYSAHLFIRGNGIIRTLALGDFQAGFGQGLVTWTGLAYGKNPDGISIRRTAGGLKPHTGTDENLFLRGAGICLGKGPLELTAFFSKKKIDANISYGDTINGEVETQFTSLQTSGSHAILSELQDRKQLGETILGANLRWLKKRWRVGFTGMQTMYAFPLEKQLSSYGQFAFRGEKQQQLSMDYALLWKNMNFFGEAAFNSSGGIAVVNGLMVAADPRFSFSILHRYYAREYNAVFSNGIAESSTASNEHGIYLGMNMRFDKALLLSGYFDRFSFPWLKYQVSAPSTGFEALAQITWQPARKTELYFRYRHREKEEDQALNNLDVPQTLVQDNVRFNLSHQVSSSVRIKTRIEYINLQKISAGENGQGFLMAQDIQWKPIGSRWSVSARYCLFETDDYDTRVYIYENDLPGSYSIPSLYDAGSRSYLMFSFDLNRHFELSGRIAQTFYSHKNIISEGSLTEISGNTKTDGKVMLRIRW